MTTELEKMAMKNVHELGDFKTDQVLVCGECPHCGGLLGVDWAFLEQVSDFVNCPMCQRIVYVPEEKND